MRSGEEEERICLQAVTVAREAWMDGYVQAWIWPEWLRVTSTWLQKSR